MKNRKKYEYTLEEVAQRDQRLEAKTKMKADDYRKIFRNLSIVTAVSVIAAASILKYDDEKRNHLDEYCAYCDFIGLKHQQKMIEKQYGTEAFATVLKDNNHQLSVYYIDDQGEKQLIKNYYNKRR